MDCADLSDLEEGEILEYESVSPSNSKCDDFEIKGCSFHSLRKEYKSYDFQSKGNHEGAMYICERGRDGYINKTAKHKWKFSENLGNMNSNISMVDLESISSEEDHKSDEENKYSGENKEYMLYCESRNKRKKQSTQFYGMVEDIMSEIGETICRKSRCNYKKRKSRESQRNLNKYSGKSYDLWSHKIFSSHLKNKKHKRNISPSDSGSVSDSAKERVEKRKKKKKRRYVYYEEEKKCKKNSQVRDFDEVRRTLLEKLKKQKAEEESKASTNGCTQEIENSGIQEVDMLIDCTNYVDNPRDAMPEDSVGEEGVEEKEPEDELDLIKLRLIALASNKKQRCEESTPKSVNAEDLPQKSLDNRNEEVDLDLDRNELLLRAEALKTALLKKHQNRLNRLKMKKVNGTENAKDVIPNVETINGVRSEEVSANLDYADGCKENMEREREGKETGSFAHDLNHEVKINESDEIPSESRGTLRKTHPRPKTKRKKRKSGSFANNLKEHRKNIEDKSETFEEDDRTLRSQLLSDLMKKKSLKNIEEKSVLSRSIQASVNKPPTSVINCQPPKEDGKSSRADEKTLLKKVNPPKIVKPLRSVKIPKAEIQRIIVHLGSEDSSDEDDTPCRARTELGAEENLKEEMENKKKTATELTHENKLIRANYEKSVELLLSQARKKIEGEKQTGKESTLATPEAVYKHLPPSQRIEYIRLKQKIAERERLRKEKRENSSTFAPVDTKFIAISTKESPKGKEAVERVSQELTSKAENTLNAAIKPAASSSNNSLVSKSSLSSKPMVVLNSPSSNRAVGRLTSFNRLGAVEASERRILSKTKNDFEGVCGKELLPDKEQKPAISIHRNRLLLPSSQALISKLKLLLKKIKIEKIIEENYEKKIVKLKNQLSLLEKKKNEQRFKIKKLGEESMKTYKAIQGITAKSNEKAVPTDGTQNKEGDEHVSKNEEKKKEDENGTEGKKVSNEPEMELSKAQSKTDKRLNNGDKISESIARGKSADVCLLDYQSPLQVFNKVSFCSERVDPNVMMCQFDLTGVCKDEECTYQHLRMS